MRSRKDEDLLRTDEVAAVPTEAMEPPPATVRVPGVASDAGWLDPDTSITRATEKTLSVASSVNADRAGLTLLNGLNAGQMLALDGLDYVIGRGPGVNLCLEDPAISRNHARVACHPDGRFYIEDLGSTNGTFVSGRRVEGRTDLKNGDRIQLGVSQILRFAITDGAEEELHRRLYESSTRDALTRAHNRRYLDERLVAEIASARRDKTQLALAMIDLDRFKEVNDKHGHLAGDIVLREVASNVQRLIRIEDVLARYGGEEFVILARSTAHKDAGTLAERIRSTIERIQITLPHRDNPLSVTVSIGVASLSELPPEGGVNELVAVADARLYRAKIGGRNRVCAED